MAMNYMVFGTGLDRAAKAARRLGPDAVRLVQVYKQQAYAAYARKDYSEAEALRREALRAAQVLNETIRAGGMF